MPELRLDERLQLTKTLLAWSTGKDSCYALHALGRSSTHEVAGLLSMFSSHDRVFMHAVRPELVQMQARALGLPLTRLDFPPACSHEAYEALFVAALRQAHDAGIRAIAFGDLYLAGIRAHREALAHRAGLEAVFPLWLDDQDTAGLAARMIADGVDAIITCADPRKLDPSWVGRRWSELLAQLPPGVDPCAEEGEFHTFAVSAPAFGEPLRVEVAEVVARDGFVFADVIATRG